MKTPLAAKKIATGPVLLSISGAGDKPSLQSPPKVPLAGIKAEKPSTNIASASFGAQGAVSQFIELEMEMRRCVSLDDMRYLIANGTRRLIAYDQAFVLEPGLGKPWCVTTVTSVSKIDRQASAVRLIEAWACSSLRSEQLARCDHLIADLEKDVAEIGTRDRASKFQHALWMPLKARDGRTVAGFLMLRGDEWQQPHAAVAHQIGGAYSHAWSALLPSAVPRFDEVKRRVSKLRLALALAAISAIAAFVPVSMSALAPSEIATSEPVLVTAPIDGVIGEILAPPGSWVEQGAPIVKFVDVKLRNDFEIALRNRNVAEAKYFKVVQSATATQKDMQDVATTRAELELADADLTYSSELLERAVIRAARAGLLVYSSKSDWLGKPVMTGERLMEIGDPSKAEVRIDLPLSDAIAVREGGSVALFLDGDPLNAIDATISRMSFRPTLTAEQQLAYRIHASFNDGQARRIGLRGIARVSGDKVTLWFYLFRRPFAALRQRVGL